MKDFIYETYKKTGTFSPLLNQKEYSEDEKIVLLHFFTNIDKNVYCATDNMSSQLWAFLVGQYSRTELSMRDRFLNLFSEYEKAYNEGKISKEDYISLSSLAEEIRKSNNKGIKFFNDKASEFLKKWGVNYGHNSLKDADTIRFAIEGVSQVFTKVIEAPFPPLGNFQEKSTRYVSFSKENVIYSPALLNSEFSEKIKEINEELLTLYDRYLPIVRKIFIQKGIIKRKDFKSQIAFENTLKAKVFDVCRYFLPAGVRTSLGASFSTRVCETHLSEMLSHPLEEVRAIAKSMHEEALKISPGLLSHVKKNEYFSQKRGEILEIVKDIFYKKDLQSMEIIRGIEDCNRVKLIDMDEIDNIIVASILYENGKIKGVSYLDCLNRVELMDNNKKSKIMEAEFGHRGKFDRFPRSVQHGRIQFEFLTDFGAYRDYQRHRASNQIWQGVTAIYGYDYPEFIDLSEMTEFKRDYDNVMEKITTFSRSLIEKYPYDSEYIVAFGHLVRSTFEMHPGQLAYVLELRTTPQGHHSYRRLFQKVGKILEEKAPLFMKFVRVNYDEDSSRKEQEEKASQRLKL